MDVPGGFIIHGVGLGWRNPAGRMTVRPRGGGTWQINLFHHPMLLQMDGAELRIDAPSAICYSPEQPQWYRGLADGFTDDWLSCSGPLRQLLTRHAVPLNTPFRIANSVAVEGCLRDLRSELDLRLPFASEAVADLLRSVVRLLARGRDSATRHDPRRITLVRLREELRERCGEPWTVETMAAAASMAPHRFAVLYRRWIGSSPLHDLTWFRMRQAQTMLESGKTSVAKVAAACGYADPLYFSRVFRRWTGIPPSAHPVRS